MHETIPDPMVVHVRILVSFFSLLVGAFSLSISVVYTFGPDLAKTTIEHNLQLKNTFNEAAEFVATYQAQQARLPTSQEFEAWAATYPSVPYTSPNGMKLQLNSFPDEAVHLFGPPPKNAFLLVYWSGEWFEYYSSWANSTSLVFEPSDYYLLGSKYAGGSIAIVVAILTIVMGWRLWPNKALKWGASFAGTP